MKNYPPSELLAFLDAVDRNLDQRIELTLIGGGAAALAYGIENATKDLDTLGTGGSLDALQRAVRLAQTQTGLAIPFGPAGVVDAPHDFESRLVEVLAERGWQRLRLWVLERHDFALSKIIRGVQGDIDHIVAVHRRQPLDLDILVERYLHEMNHVIGRPASLRQSFLWCIEELFGELAREDVAQRVGARRR